MGGSNMEKMFEGMGKGSGAGDEMKQMENVWKYLDKLHESDPKEYEQFVKGQMQEGRKMHQEEEGKKASRANPEVWRVAKTTGELGRQVVVLMRSCEQVAAPSAMGDDRVPIWVGDAKLTKDPGDGSTITVFDAVFHPEVQARAKGNEEGNKRYTRAVVRLAMDSIAETHGIIIDAIGFKLTKKKDYQHATKLPFCWDTSGGGTYNSEEAAANNKGVFDCSAGLTELSSVGRSSESRGGAESAPLSNQTGQEEIKLSLGKDEKGDGKKPLIQVVSETSSGILTPEYSMRHKDEEGERQTILCIRLPGVRSVGDVELEVGSTEVSVSVEERYELLLELPYAVDPDTPRAQFDKAQQELTLILTHA